jgi:hypothetical protein
MTVTSTLAAPRGASSPAAGSLSSASSGPAIPPKER